MKLGFCVACGNTADLHHIRLVFRGGDDDSNLITVCGSCNAKRRLTKAERIEQARERAEALRPVFTELNGLSSYEIATELNRRDIPAPGSGPWRSMKVLRMLSRLKD